MVKSVNLELIPYDALPCHAKVFKINGKDADIDEFGYYVDGDYDDCDDEDICRWGCFDRYYHGEEYSCNKEVADKYGLTEEQYNEIVSTLEETFAIGTCGWCV